MCPVVRIMGSPCVISSGSAFQAGDLCLYWHLNSMVQLNLPFCLSPQACKELSTSRRKDVQIHPRLLPTCFFKKSCYNFGCGSLEFAQESRLSLEILTIWFLTYTPYYLLAFGSFMQEKGVWKRKKVVKKGGKPEGWRLNVKYSWHRGVDKRRAVSKFTLIKVRKEKWMMAT